MYRSMHSFTGVCSSNSSKHCRQSITPRQPLSIPPTLLFRHFLIAAGHRRRREPHELEAVVDHHVRDALVRKSDHAQAKLGENGAIPDGLGVRKVEQIVETGLQRVAVDRAFLALHHRVESVHVPTELAVLREREILVRRDGLKQRLDLLRICNSQSTCISTLNQGAVQRFDLRNVVSKNKHVHKVGSRSRFDEEKKRICNQRRTG